MTADSAHEIREFGVGDDDVELAYPIMRELRDHLDLETFSGRYRAMYWDDGFRIVGLFAGDECRAVAGYRWVMNFAIGDSLYVDDLVTAPRWRSAGYGAALLTHLTELARARGVGAVHLDSGIQRSEAHRFYEREGFSFVSKHFLRRP
ncbi:MAG: GNAT family N-acetyltransferase [Solirubrobacterales bacterium]